MQQLKIQERTIGRWRNLLPALGIPSELLNGKHQSCPFCGGKDRFRFTDWHGSGAYFCNKCGRGDGFDLVKKYLKLGSFQEVKQLIEGQLPNAKVEIKKATESSKFDCERFWSECHEIRQHDAAGKYLKNRGIQLTKYPKALRFHPCLRYMHEDKTVTRHPGMVAKFTSPDETSSMLQFTYLDDDGHKAKVPKPKKFSPNPTPRGGSVKLYSKQGIEKLGVAEGVETALSAAKLFNIPVWATFSSVNLLKWLPPSSAKKVIIFSDNDDNFVGQNAAFSLGYTLSHLFEHLEVTVQVPDRIDTDWNDELADLHQLNGGTQ